VLCSADHFSAKAVNSVCGICCTAVFACLDTRTAWQERAAAVLMADPFLRKATKRKVDMLLYSHFVFALVAGSLAFIVPHIFEYFMIHHGEKFALRDNGDPAQKVEHLTVRLYGALILAQAVITWSARKSNDAAWRRALVQAYCLCFSLTTLALARAQLTPGGNFNNANWINILMFAGLSVAYGWFAFFEKVTAFEGLGKATL